jgi:hypothetical protein
MKSRRRRRRRAKVATKQEEYFEFSSTLFSYYIGSVFLTLEL